MIDLEVKFGVTFMVIAVIAIAMVVLNLYKSEYNPYNFGYISIYKWDCTPQKALGKALVVHFTSSKWLITLVVEEIAMHTA